MRQSQRQLQGIRAGGSLGGIASSDNVGRLSGHLTNGLSEHGDDCRNENSGFRVRAHCDWIGCVQYTQRDGASERSYGVRSRHGYHLDEGGME